MNRTTLRLMVLATLGLSALLVQATALAVSPDTKKRATTVRAPAPVAKEASSATASLSAERRDEVLQSDSSGSSPPVQNPYATQVEVPGGGTITVNPDGQAIQVESLELMADTSGARALIARFSTRPVEPTHFRIVHVTDENSAAPFAGVPWRSYTGGDVNVPIGCSTGYDDLQPQKVALQVRGPDRPNPNLAGSMMPNVSGPAVAQLRLAASALARITSIGPGRGMMRPIEQSVPGPEPSDGLVLQGSQTVHRVGTFVLGMTNVPRPPRLQDIRSSPQSCFTVTAVGGATRSQIVLDGYFSTGSLASAERNACQPRIRLRQCGRGGFSTLSAPDTYERVQVVHQQTAQLKDWLDPVSLQQTWSEQDGDLVAALSALPGLPRGTQHKIRFRRNTSVAETFLMTWSIAGSGACMLGPTGLLSTAPTSNGIFQFERTSDMHWAYDRVPERYLVPEGLETYDGRGVLVVQQSCPVTGGSIRTTLQKVTHSWWRKQQQPRTLRK